MALATGIAATAVHAQPQPPAQPQPQPQPPGYAVTCTNPASGATWQIDIDYAHATVDAHPARIGEAEISWHDPSTNANYTLDRKSGALTMVGPSSTGGYFLHDRCRLPP